MGATQLSNRFLLFSLLFTPIRTVFLASNAYSHLRFPPSHTLKSNQNRLPQRIQTAPHLACDRLAPPQNLANASYLHKTGIDPSKPRPTRRRLYYRRTSQALF